MKKFLVKNIPPLQMGRLDQPVVGQYYLSFLWGHKYVNYITETYGVIFTYKSKLFDNIKYEKVCEIDGSRHLHKGMIFPGNRKCYIKIPTDDFYLDI